MYHVIKYTLDFCLALCLLVILSPIFLIITLLLLFQTKGGIFFKQQRPGLHRRIFKIYKFKTMRDLYLENGELAPDEDRLTKFGLFLRKSSLDELPSLLNIIKGEMSFVGPRPLLVGYLPLYSKEQARRHDVRPGLTGWAQVNGRNAISWEQKFTYDVWYIDHSSFLLDSKILLLTFKKVFSRSDIQAEGHVSMPKFTGSKVNRNNKC